MHRPIMFMIIMPTEFANLRCTVLLAANASSVEDLTKMQRLSSHTIHSP